MGKLIYMGVYKKAGAQKAAVKKKVKEKGIRTKDAYIARPGKPGGVKYTTDYTEREMTSYLEEPVASYTSRIRAIGNSKGVILNNQLMETAGLKQDSAITIQAADGIIIIKQVKETGVNKNLSTWDKAFKAAIKRGAKPKKDLFEGIKNEFDTNEW